MVSCKLDISLNEKPCLNCPYLDAEIEKNDAYKDGGHIIYTHQIVYCAHKDLCTYLMNYLREELKNEESIQKESPDE